MDILGSLLKLAAEQHGVVARSQALELGLPPTTFDRWMRQQGWRNVGAGLWSPPGTDETPWTRLSAATLTAGPQTLVTGLAGLWAAGLDIPFPTSIRLVAPMNRHANRSFDIDRVKVIASRTVTPGDGTTHRRVQCATAPRCFVDMVVPPSPPVGVVRDTLITAVQARATSVGEVYERVDRAKGVPGRRVLLRALEDVASTGADSPFTLRVQRRLERSGFRPDAHPATIETPGRTLHPDITFTAARVAIECDSMLAHSRQRDLAIDHKKDRAYRDAGWVVLRIGWWEFHRRWDGFVADLQRALVAAQG
jgi:hypothetical protein